MNSKEKGMILIGIILVVVLIIVVYEIIKKTKKEGYRKCICSSEQGGRERECQETDVVQALYNENKLTEFSKLKPKGWSTTSPGDVTWPLSNGCLGADCSGNEDGCKGGTKKWFAWDFTDFGN
jgi:hypothetical protein